MIERRATFPDPRPRSLPSVARLLGSREARPLLPSGSPGSPGSVLVVEDEEDILELVRYNLERAGFSVRGVSRGEEALRLVRAEPPDLVVLDLMLPGLDGFEVCRLLKNDERTSEVVVVVLSARGEEADVVRGLELGADDYVTKPFSPKVLVARVRAALRRRERAGPDEAAVIRLDDLVVDPGRHEVLVEGEPVTLTHTEFRILHFLAARRGWVFTRSQIVDASRGPDHPVTERSVDVHVFSLRKKLGPCRRYVETVRGVGYRFSD